MDTPVNPRLIEDLEDQIKKGEGQAVKRFLSSLNTRGIERRFALRLANLCRRVNINQIGLRILNPIMRSEKGSRVSASAAEKAEYSVLLQRVGAVEEAIVILKSLDQRSCPEAALYLAFCFFTKWDYGSAIPYLNGYISNPGITDYQKTVGQVNLSAALVHEERFLDAKKLLDEIHEVSQRNSYLLLYGNSLEIRSQLEISAGNYKSARKYIRLASVNLTQFKSLDEFFVRKWDAVATCLEKKEVAVLDPIRAEALQLKHWETVRDCDFFCAFVSRDRELFLKVFFGTPFPAYRRKLLRRFHWEAAPPDFYTLSRQPQATMLLDIANPEAVSPAGGEPMPAGQLMHRALILLSRDFYRPQRMGALFSGLYPDEYFHPHSSPDRIHQMILRLRRWIRENQLPLSVEESAGGYSLEPGPELALTVPREPLPLMTEELLMMRLRSLHGGGEFTAKNTREALNCSYTTANRLLSWALAQGKLTRLGSGSRTTYRFSV